MAPKLWWLYILRCHKDNSLYVGITTDIDKRVRAHQEGKGAKYTKGRGPIELVYNTRSGINKSDALKWEYKIKRMSKQDKEKLVIEGIEL